MKFGLADRFLQHFGRIGESTAPAAAVGLSAPLVHGFAVAVVSLRVLTKLAPTEAPLTKAQLRLARLLSCAPAERGWTATSWPSPAGLGSAGPRRVRRPCRYRCRVDVVVAVVSLCCCCRVAVGPRKACSKRNLPPKARYHLVSAVVHREAHLQHLFMKVLVHPLHSAPQTDQEGLAGFALHWGPLLKPLLQPGPEPLHDIKVRAAFGEVLLHSETLLSSCRNRVCIPKTRLMILDQMHDLRHATAKAGTLIR